MNHTSNYQLNQWAKSDQVKMEDFNADNAKIDAAIKAVDAKADSKADASVLEALAAEVSKERLKFGSYTGDGKASRIVTLPWTPQIAILFGRTYSRDSMVILMQDLTFYISNGGISADPDYAPLLSGDKIQIQNTESFNQSSQITKYILIR